MGGAREFVIRRGTPDHFATSSSETRTVPTLASLVTGRHSRLELALCPTHARSDPLMRLRPGLQGGHPTVVACQRYQSRKGFTICLGETYESSSATGRTTGTRSARSSGRLSSPSPSSESTKQRALETRNVSKIIPIRAPSETGAQGRKKGSNQNLQGHRHLPPVLHPRLLLIRRAARP